MSPIRGSYTKCLKKKLVETEVSGVPLERMAALIQGCFHVDVDELQGTDEQKIEKFMKLWGRAKYYLEKVNQVTFN